MFLGFVKVKGKNTARALAMMYVIYAALVIGNWVLLCNYNSFLSTILSVEGFYCFLFSIKFCFIY